MVIKRLAPEVVNRIAAGEVIIRPVNAVKELIENSLDAGASSITIIIGGGGLQTINILDDGKGILVDDHALLCERFATSKLRSADDLVDGSIDSFGFRGEALASISLVSHVAVTSKSDGDSDETGYESRFKDGVMLPGYPAVVPFNGQSGTRIVIDDLFYNNPVRKRAFKNPSTEYKKILELVSRFSIAFPRTGFKVRKIGETSFDLFEEVSHGSRDDRFKRIDSLTGIAVHDLVSIYSEDSNDTLPEPLRSFEFVCSNPNGSPASQLSKGTTIVVINNRLVDSTSNLHIVKLIEAEICSNFQSNKLGFLFLSMSIDPRNLDVNVCPTKGRVVFANSSAVERFVVDKVMTVLLEKKRSKLIKLNKIQFASSFVIRETKPEEPLLSEPLPEPIQQVSKTQPFKVHTCPKQNLFITPSKLRDQSLSQEPFMLSLTQVDVPIVLDSQDMKGDALGAMCESLSGVPLVIPSNPRDFVFVGDIQKDGFVLCQHFTRLCICNTTFLSKQLIKHHLYKTKFSLVGSPIGPTDNQNIPSWMRSMFDYHIPSLRGSSAPGWQIEILFKGISTARFSDEISQRSVERLAEIVAEWIIETEYESNVRTLWDEVIRNKNLLAGHSLSSNPPEPLTVNNSLNFQFREIISLKELYKEFERC